MKKLLGILLSLCMVMCFMPSMAFAEANAAAISKIGNPIQGNTLFNEIATGYADLPAAIKKEVSFNRFLFLKNIFGLKNIKAKYNGKSRLTGYSLAYECCGKKPTDPGYGITASGETATEGITVAASSKYKIDTLLYIQGIGLRLVQDRGGAIKGSRLDVFYEDTKDCFQKKSNKMAKVWVISCK